MMLTDDGGLPAVEAEAAEAFVALRVAGVIVTPLSAAISTYLARHQVPVVEVDRRFAAGICDAAVVCVPLRSAINPSDASSFKLAPTSPNAWKFCVSWATVSVPWMTISNERTRDDSLCLRCASSRLPASVLTGTSAGFIGIPPFFRIDRPLHPRPQAVAPAPSL